MSVFNDKLNKYVNRKEIKLVNTDTLYYEFHAFDRYGRDYDLSGKTAKMDIIDGRNQVLISLSTEDDSIVLNSNNTIGNILLNKDGINIEGIYKYDLRLVDDTTNNIYTIMYGKLVIQKNITNING